MQIHVTLDDFDNSSNRIIWERLKYYYNHGALEFNRKIIEESNLDLTPYHFRIGTSKCIETLISEIPKDKIIFNISKGWELHEIFQILESMSIVFSDYVGSKIICKIIQNEDE